MSRKHFEALAKTVADLYWGLKGATSIEDETLLELLFNELCYFCSNQNAMFNRQRFKSRVLQLLGKE